MGRYRVSCINKREHYNAHERIQYIGSQGVWKMSEDSAISRIQSKQDSFYVDVNGKSVEIVVAEHLGRKYLKTEADGYAPNNLLNLDECKNCEVK